MRHLWSFLAGLVVAPVTWVLVALGQDGSGRTIDRWVELGTFNTANLIEPAVYLGVAGLLFGLVGMLRVSPLGPLVAGLLLVAPYVGMLVAPFDVRDQVPADWKVFGDPLPLLLPVRNGTLFLIGVALLMAVFSGGRWRRWPRPVPAPVAETGPVTEEPAFALTDFDNPARPDERDTAPLSLGYPDEPPTDPLPRRTAGASPWSQPPGAGQRDDTA
ncbi:hypothetical protein [Micromonospora sagamiensis]|uniref:Uncharacterized protein n=1 Tax=Micromonospora sagamiensis TaxID=47875 RepID=A0A562WLW5_9ACTN|nr:hypothetical protein [Micromonospora sagamiensis]TWJ31188.1 hypothetical protein JD81_04742 [Micromonospora sagamiensis]BCL15767.1 hypothetical protein GCM10017556_35060 [Micromonospora sagamiensis]